MTYVILGAGQVGFQVAQFLSQEGHTVTVIDNNRKLVVKLQDRLDCKIVIDDGKKQEVLKEANIQDADYFVAVTNYDDTNLISCSLVRQLAPKTRCIARLRNDKYLEYIQSIKSTFNITEVVQPEREIATSIIRSIEYGRGMSEAFSFIDFNRIQIRSYRIVSESVLVHQPVSNFRNSLHFPQENEDNFLIAMIQRDDTIFLPSGSDVLQEGDELYFIGSMNDLDTLFYHLGRSVKERKNIRKIMIIGGGAVTSQILDIYSSKTTGFTQLIGKSRVSSRNIVVVESDEKLCEEIADNFPDITVLNADVTEEQTLEDIEISSADLVITATGSQELNIVVAAHSHNLGVKQTMAVVHTSVYSEIAEELGISVSFSIRGALTNSIISLLRGYDSVLNVAYGDLSIFTHKVSPENYAYKKKIKDLRIPKDSLIMCINRGDTSFIAQGNIEIEDKDQLLVMSKKNSLDKITELFPINKE